MHSWSAASPIAANHQVARVCFTHFTQHTDRLVSLQVHGRFENSSQTVEVALTQGIVLVVVTLGTTQLQTEQHRRDGSREFIQQVVPAFFLRIDVRHVGSGQAERCGDQRTRVVRHQLVASQLQSNESVVRQILIECSNHPVAISPGAGPQLVVFESVRLGEPRQIEPELGEVLAVRRRRQQTVHATFVRIGPRVG